MMLKLFHVSVLSLNLYTIWYDQMYVKIPFPHEKLELYPLKARLIFLTMWCLIIQTAYFGVALLNDILGTNEPRPKKTPMIRAIKDAMFGAAFPLATYVAVAFWTVYFIDRELIFPKALDQVMPSWVNHVLHSTIFIFMIVELVASARKSYPSKKIVFLLLSCMNLAYLSCLFFVYYDCGVWVYPMFAVLSWLVRSAFFIVNSALVYVLCLLCEQLNMTASNLRLTNPVRGKNKTM